MGELVEMATPARDIIGDRVPLIVETVAIRLQDSIRKAEHAAKNGAAALLGGSPACGVPTKRENALSNDRAADLPIMLYNYLACMGIMTGKAFQDRVGRGRNFRAIKASAGDINRVHLPARDYPRVQLSCRMNGYHAGPPPPPLKSLNKEDKRQLEQVVRVLRRTVAEIVAESHA